MPRRLNRWTRERVNDVLEAMGTDTKNTAQILKDLTVWNPTRRELNWFIKNYMENRFVTKQRDYDANTKEVTFTALVR